MKINALRVISHHVFFMHVPAGCLVGKPERNLYREQTGGMASGELPTGVTSTRPSVRPSLQFGVLLCDELAGRPSSPAGWSRAGVAPFPWR